jgi:hypothetical protein
MELLDGAGRVDEIGRMIGGASLTEQVRASARELLTNAAHAVPDTAQPDKQKAKAKGESRKRKWQRDT